MQLTSFLLTREVNIDNVVERHKEIIKLCDDFIKSIDKEIKS
jgi:hypothetical protein